MLDGEGTPHLVELQAPAEESVLRTRNGANNQYWLFTRRNTTSRQIIVHGNVNSNWSSNYKGSRPRKVIVHGWNSNGNTDHNLEITAAFLAVADVNVIVVDWSGAAGSLYSTAVRLVSDIGVHLTYFMTWLFYNAGGNWNNVHLVGHSLGAHVVGSTGHAVWGQPMRVTGLDPTGPQWGGNSNALNRNFGVYVESIHTDGGVIGIMDAISDADFYPNGGRNPQPGCSLSTCSHGRAPLLFASSIRQTTSLLDNVLISTKFPTTNVQVVV